MNKRDILSSIDVSDIKVSLIDNNSFSSQILRLLEAKNDKEYSQGIKKGGGFLLGLKTGTDDDNFQDADYNAQF